MLVCGGLDRNGLLMVWIIRRSQLVRGYRSGHQIKNGKRKKARIGEPSMVVNMNGSA